MAFFSGNTEVLRLVCNDCGNALQIAASDLNRVMSKRKVCPHCLSTEIPAIQRDFDMAPGYRALLPQTGVLYAC